MFYVWGSIVLISVLGFGLREDKNLGQCVSGKLLSSVIFFIVTNFGACLSLYPHTMGRFAAMLYFSHSFFQKHLS